MNWVTDIVVYIILWWLVLFMVLPVGVRTAHDLNQEVEPGHAPSAPMQPRILWKFVATTLIAGVLLGAFLLVQQSDLISFRSPGG